MFPHALHSCSSKPVYESNNKDLIFCFLSFLCALWVGRGCRSPEHGFVSPLLVQDSRRPPWGKDLEQFGTQRPRRTCSWPKAACSRFGIASPILWCCYLRKWIFPAVLGGWAWSLPFLLGIRLWETSGEEAEMTTPILQTGKLRPSYLWHEAPPPESGTKGS